MPLPNGGRPSLSQGPNRKKRKQHMGLYVWALPDPSKNMPRVSPDLHRGTETKTPNFPDPVSAARQASPHPRQKKKKKKKPAAVAVQ